MEDIKKADRENNFGVVRLLLACFVVFSHSPEMIDGNRSREPLTLLFGTISLGGFAVDGFFLLSGYLITKSCVQRRSVAEYALRRATRILPGYAVSFVICALLIAPFVGAGAAAFKPFQLLRLGSELTRLLAPSVPGVFPGLPIPALNGSMWTIAYEARCYVVALMAGLAGLYGPRSRVLYLGMVACLLVVTGFGISERLPHTGEIVLGDPIYTCRLMALFGSGALFYLFRREIALHGWIAVLSAVSLAISLNFPVIIESAIALFGGYLIFYCALAVPPTALSRFCNKIDVSYGLYLYAYPIQNLLLYIFKVKEPLALSLFTMPLAFGAGLLSWRLIEAPALDFGRRWIQARRIAHDRAVSAEQAPAN